MRLPRMTTRWWMIVVAVVAVVCAAAAALLERRRERLARIAERHISVFLTPTTDFPDPETWSGIRLDWHGEMADKYLRATRYPWLPVAPDPPDPGW
jgi:hypothetical protein